MTEHPLHPHAIPRITHARAEEVAMGAYEQLLDLLDRLEDAHWAAPTDCDRWDVDAMVGHLIGAARSNASIREAVRQQLWGRRHAGAHDGNALDALNELQVTEHAHLSPDEKLATLRDIIPKAAHARTHVPALLRRIPIPMGLDSGSAMPGTQPTMTIGQLNEVVYTRDTWLHTVDIERATGVKADRSGTIDRIVIHDAVADWMGLHRQPVRLSLTGGAGGEFVQGEGGPHVTLDAIEWARTVSGRVRADGLLAHPVVF